MFYVPLHHKYRPQTFAQLVGQEAITTTLTNAIVNRKIAPAYLFTGPRGTGKTSSARILAKSLNCLKSDVPTPDPCGECEVCKMITVGSALDVIEIDAASNTGVDNIRELIEKSQFAPVQCRYKVYVIDECHMLSQAAFNALLKTLEEPPERVVFVLATTDPQRVLSTIISRCQRFDYRRIPLDSMVSHLINIAKKENIDIEKDAVTLVAQIANGGLRDAESLLDQLSLLAGTITVEKVWDLVGAVPEKDLLELLREIKNNNSEGVINQCRHLMNRGREPLIVLQNLASFYLSLLIAKTAPQRSDLVAVTSPTWQELCQDGKEWEISHILQGQKILKDSEFQIKNTTQPRLWLEVTLLSLLPSAQITTITVETNPQNGKNPPESKINIPQNNLKNQSISTNIVPEKSLTSSPNQTVANTAPIENITTAKAPINVIDHNSMNLKDNEENNSEKREENHQDEDFNLQSNDEMWQKFLQYLQPPTTKALLQQHCYLISISGDTVCLGVKNEALLKLAQGKISNAQTAFELLLNRKVKVKLQVMASDVEKKNLNNENIYSLPESKKDFTAQTDRHQAKNNIIDFNSHKEKKLENKETLVNEEITKQNPTSDDNLSLNGKNSLINDQDNIVKIEKFDYENISEKEIEQISAKLAEIFKGEVVEIDHYSLIDEEEKPELIEDNSQEIPANPPVAQTNLESDLKNEISQDNNISEIKIINRPDISMYENEDDIPF
jgi:DNA polymerase III subunit gamma/tau